MNKVELLAPAGDLEKLRIAFLYGADAVYAGGKYFSLRARASNFSLDDIKKGAEIALKLNKKFYITMNIIPHNDDFEGLIEYLKYLEDVHVTGIICTSQYIASVALEYAPKLERHLSTQTSVTNNKACEYYKAKGFSRIVLAREATLEEIEKITQNTDIDLEVFIHGGMCTSYSGRCMLSNYMTSRDANRGGCAHSCRWDYDIYLANEKLTNNYLNIGSKDLCAAKYIERLIKLNVASLKIEGRMKSIYYIAVVCRAYRMLIDFIYENKTLTNEIITFFESEIIKAENRKTSCGFLNGDVTINEQLYNVNQENPTKDFLGIVLDYDGNYITLEQRNYFKTMETVEIITKGKKTYEFQIEEILDNDGNVIDVCRHPLQIVKFKCPYFVEKYDIMRRK